MLDNENKDTRIIHLPLVDYLSAFFSMRKFQELEGGTEFVASLEVRLTPHKWFNGY